MSTVDAFKALLGTHGSDAIFHRDESLVACPCLTPEGFRDPEWHEANPTAPVCNERGYLADPSTTTEVLVKAFVQPAQSARVTRITPQVLEQMFGGVQTDDHIGIFPCDWGSTVLNFKDWSQSGEDWIGYNGDRYLVVSARLIPDPSDGNPNHHWECGLRVISEEAPD